MQNQDARRVAKNSTGCEKIGWLTSSSLPLSWCSYYCFSSRVSFLAVITLFFVKIYFLSLAMLRPHCCVRTFSCCEKWSLHFLAMHWLLIVWLFLWPAGVRHLGFTAPRHVELSWSRDRTLFPCIGRWILNHCTTREAPGFL